MPQFNKAKLNRAVVVLLHHTLAMEPPVRIRISPENRRRIRRDKDDILHLLQFAEFAIRELGIGQDQAVGGTGRKRINVRPAEIPVH